MDDANKAEVWTDEDYLAIWLSAGGDDVEAGPGKFSGYVVSAQAFELDRGTALDLITAHKASVERGRIFVRGNCVTIR